MKKKSYIRQRSKPKEIASGVVLLLVTLGLVARPLARGQLFYQSYWGGAVFVPFVLFAAGVIVIYLVKSSQK